MRCAMLASVVALCGSAQGQLAKLNATMTVDNQFTAYLSTSPTMEGTAFMTGTSWPTTYTGLIDINAPGTYYLHVFAEDLGQPAMFIGLFSLSSANATFANGTQSLLTDGSQSDWTASIIGFGGASAGLVDLGPNGTSPWGNFAAMGNARFMWAAGNPTSVYFSTKITVVPAPGIASVLLAGVTLAARRRR